MDTTKCYQELLKVATKENIKKKASKLDKVRNTKEKDAKRMKKVSSELDKARRFD